MRLGVALDLRHLDDGFPAHAQLRIRLVDAFAITVDEREHQAARDIRVVRDREEVRAGFGGGLLEPGPEIFRLIAVEARVRYELLAVRLAAFHDQDSVQVLALRRRRPLPAHEGRELARLVVAVGGIHDLAPDGRVDLRVVQVRIGRDDLVHLRDQLAEHLELAAFGRHLRVALTRFRVRDARVTLQHHRHDAHEFAVVRDHEEVERRADLDACLVIRVHDRVALRIAIGRVGIRRTVLHQVGVGRVRGVQVRVAPVQLVNRAGALGHLGDGWRGFFRGRRGCGSFFRRLVGGLPAGG